MDIHASRFAKYVDGAVIGSRIRLIFPFSSDFAVGDFCSVVDCVLCAIDKAAQPAYSTIPKRGRNFML